LKIKAISLWEPWASLIRTGTKHYETRSWATSYRGPLLICAAKGGLKRQELTLLLRDKTFQNGLMPELKGNCLLMERGDEWLLQRLHFGKAVAIVELVNCIKTEDVRYLLSKEERIFGDYDPDRWAWKLKNIRDINPFPVKGKQGLFEVELPDA